MYSLSAHLLLKGHRHLFLSVLSNVGRQSQRENACSQHTLIKSTLTPWKCVDFLWIIGLFCCLLRSWLGHVGCRNWKLVGRSIRLFPRSNSLLLPHFLQAYETTLHAWEPQNRLKALFLVTMTMQVRQGRLELRWRKALCSYSCMQH